MKTRNKRERIDALDRYLEETWQITLAPEGIAWEKTLRKRLGNEYKRYKKWGGEPPEFWDYIARPAFGSWFHSGRRALILDATIVVLEAAAARAPGTMLELGAGLGYACSWLKEQLPIWRAIASDASELTIKAGEGRSAKGVEWLRLEMPHGQCEGDLDIIFANGLLSHLSEREVLETMRWIANHLKPGGLCILAVPWYEEPGGGEVLKEVWRMGLGFKDVNLIGGVIGGQRRAECEPLFTMEKGGRVEIPTDLHERITSEHKSFMAFANRPGGTRKEATFGYMRANHRNDPKTIGD